MKRPSAPGTPVDWKRYKKWKQTFPGYHSEVNDHSIEGWLHQFDEPHRDLAARILDSISYTTSGEIKTIYKDLLTNLSGWHRHLKHRQGNWFFVPFSGSTGESGDVMTNFFRMGNGMGGRFHKHQFIHRSELVRMKPDSNDTVVLIDDFAGTGSQACESWRLFEELLPGRPRVILLLIAATDKAIQRVRKETHMELVCNTILRDADNLFSANCRKFTPEEKTTIDSYCQKADPATPRGFGECGLLVVLASQCPNNSIAILHSEKNQWNPLFPRH